MIRNGFLFLLIVLTASTSSAAIDLTPTPSEYTAEGITFRQLLFKDGKRQVVYEPPAQWSYHGSANRLQLTPANANHAQAVIQALPLQSPQALDDKAISAMKEQFVRSLPPGSQAVALVSEEQNPVFLGNGVSYSITASYQVIGETFVRSALLFNLPDTQLSFNLTARKADFDALHRVFRSSILSWHWVDPKPLPGGQINSAQIPASSR